LRGGSHLTMSSSLPNKMLQQTGRANAVVRGPAPRPREPAAELVRSATGGATVAKKKGPKTAPLVLTVGSMDPSTLLPSGYSLRRPNWKQIEDAIRQMDGHWRCEVIVMVDDENYHLLGGGASDRYVCEAENPDGNFALCDPTQSEEELVNVFNGQPALYAA